MQLVGRGGTARFVVITITITTTTTTIHQWYHPIRMKILLNNNQVERAPLRDCWQGCNDRKSAAAGFWPHKGSSSDLCACVCERGKGQRVTCFKTKIENSVGMKIRGSTVVCITYGKTVEEVCFVKDRLAQGSTRHVVEEQRGEEGGRGTVAVPYLGLPPTVHVERMVNPEMDDVQRVMDREKPSVVVLHGGTDGRVCLELPESVVMEQQGGLIASMIASENLELVYLDAFASQSLGTRARLCVCVCVCVCVCWEKRCPWAHACMVLVVMRVLVCS